MTVTRSPPSVLSSAPSPPWPKPCQLAWGLVRFRLETAQVADHRLARFHLVPDANARHLPLTQGRQRTTVRVVRFVESLRVRVDTSRRQTRVMASLTKHLISQPGTSALAYY